jgi:methionyl-tRNA formyltransferase
MTTVILCGSPYSTYAYDILREINARGVRQVYVVAADPQADALKRSWGRWLAMLARRATRRCMDMLNVVGGADPVVTLESAVLAQGGQLLLVPDVNGDACQRLLSELNVDLIVLGGAPIMKAPVLRIPKIGTLNAHQGALPRYRGMNVIEWALLERRPPTVTVHFVDPGVDTGDIIRVEPIPIERGDDLQAVKRRSSALQSQLLAETVVLAQRGPLPRQTQAMSDGKQFYVMHPSLRVVAEKHLQDYIRDRAGV